MLEILIIYLTFGIIFDLTHKITRTRKMPMWVAHLQVIVGWLPIVAYSIFKQPSPKRDLYKALNKPISETGLIQKLPGIEMPGK